MENEKTVIIKNDIMSVHSLKGNLIKIVLEKFSEQEFQLEDLEDLDKRIKKEIEKYFSFKIEIKNYYFKEQMFSCEICLDDNTSKVLEYACDFRSRII